MVIGFVIFLENRHPTQTLLGLSFSGGFPLVGFIFYLLFGRNYRKEKMFRKKYFLDRQAFLQYEGQDPVSEEKIKSHGRTSKKALLSGSAFRKQSYFVWHRYKSIDKWGRNLSLYFRGTKEAVHHIHLEYYIVRNDDIGEKIQNIS